MDRIAFLAQLASVLEVSTEKPGNVSPSHDFADTTYEDYLLGSVGVGLAVKAAAVGGFKAGSGNIPLSEVGIGELIRKGVDEINRLHVGGNTHLGILLLFIPLASSAGFCVSRGVSFERGLQENAVYIIENSSVRDSLNFYEAIKSADVGGLTPTLREPDVPFHELMRVSSSVDRIAEELSGGMKLTFEFSVPTLDNVLQRTDNMRKAVLQTYLIILSEFPDSLISKKLGIEKALEVSMKATEVLEAGGIFSEAGSSALKEFDDFLRTDDNRLNPGTTADLVAAAVFVWLLYNYSQEAHLP